MACYPLFACKHWECLAEDLNDLGDTLVSFSCVPDPLGNHNVELLQECFPDVCASFKTHFAIDLSKPLESYVSQHHQRNIKSAHSKLRIEFVETSETVLKEWVALYDVLIDRHSITGIARFSEMSFEKLFDLKDLKIVHAISDGETVGILLWITQDSNAYYHLGAYSAKGYALNASFALFDFSIRLFQDNGLLFLNLGGGAGAGTVEDDGLARFKRGWSSETRTASFCGRILNPVRYAELSAHLGPSATRYFPAYREGEFT